MNLFHHDDEEEDARARQSCTDLPCCIVFIVALAGFVIMYSRIYWDGNISKLFHGMNYAGQVCGVDDPVKFQPYLYWCAKGQVAGVPQIEMNRPICVEACPGNTANVAIGGAAVGASYEVVPDCQYVTGPEGMSSYKTELVLNRYCLPDSRVYRDMAKDLSGKQFSSWEAAGAEAASSVVAAWPILLGAFFLAVFLGYVYLTLLRHCAEVLVYASILLCVVGFAISGVWLIANAGTVSTQVRDSMNYEITLPEEFARNEETITRIVGGLCLLFSAIAVCLGCCFHRSIQIGAACVEVACDTMFEMPSLLLLPVLKAFVKGILSLILLAGFVQLWSMSGVKSDVVSQTSYITHSQEQYIEIVLYMLMSFWILCFVNALYQFIIAYGVSEYYYTPYDHDGEKDVGCCALWDGFYYGVMLHGGSLALGSLLIALLMTLQKIIEYAEKENEDGTANPVARGVLCMCGCCVNCCKETIQYINKLAYIDIAITSNDFCSAAKDSVVMIAELGGAMAILNGATLVFTVFGVVLSILGTSAFTWIICTQGIFTQQNSEFDVPIPVAPTIVAGLLGGLVSFAFMHVFDMTSDTLLYCYGYDMHNNRPTPNAPAALKELVHG